MPKKFNFTEASADPSKIRDKAGKAPFSVVVFTGATKEAKLGVVWSNGSLVAIYNTNGDIVYGTSQRARLYLEGKEEKVVKYCGVYQTYDRLFRKSHTLTMVNASPEEMKRIVNSPSFEKWLSGPTVQPND